MEIIGIIAIGLFIVLVFNAGLILRWRLIVGKYPTKKVFIWCNIIMFIIFILFAILPKSNGECKINIIIDNKNSISEVIINKKYNYYIAENKIIKLENLDSSGFIAIKTQNDAFIGIYLDETHLFKTKHTININIIDNKIFIDSFPKLSVGAIINDIEEYDKTKHLFNLFK
jgi:hypothetical protein